MRCSACQTEIPEEASACSECGGAASHAPSADETPTLQASAIVAKNAPGAIPERLDNYQLLRRPDGELWELGRGAMGITYKAFDTDLHVEVVLKVIHPAALAFADSRSRFLREARAAAKLRHANIASIFRLDEVEGVQFYAMEFCDGETVHEFVERHGPLELKLALEVALQVSHALVVAQALGIVHRDIKPANLMITGKPPEEFTVKVIDFGLAKLGGPGTAAADVTDSSARAGFVGTAHFASPEQLEDRSVDFRSDIYSLGVTLYFMLTARALFEGPMARVVVQQLSDKASLEKVAWLPPQTLALLEKMLAKKPVDRPASTRDLRAALRACLDDAALAPATGAAPVQPAPAPPPMGDADADLHFAPPAERSPRAAEFIPATRVETSALQPATSGPPAHFASPLRPPKPARRSALMLAAGILGLLAITVLVFALVPLSRRLVDSRAAQPAPPPAAASPNEPELRAALRDAHEAQDAAERLSVLMHTLAVNRKSAEVPQTDRPAADELERNIRDAEAAYLVAAKSLSTFPPDTQRAAFAKLAEDASAAGASWRIRVAEIIRGNIPQLPLDAVRVDAATRDRLRRLQEPE